MAPIPSRFLPERKYWMSPRIIPTPAAAKPKLQLARVASIPQMSGPSAAPRLANAAAKLGIKVIHVRKATRTVAGPGRPACHYCGNCMAGCDVVAKYNSADVHMLPAVRTGKLRIVPNAVVREVMLSEENRVTGVRYIDRVTKKENEIRAKSVVVSCACVQSVALLLMSRSRR